MTLTATTPRVAASDTAPARQDRHVRRSPVDLDEAAGEAASSAPRGTGSVEGTLPGAPVADPVVVVRRLAPPRERFELLQQFEGTVLRLEGDEFQARYRDLTDPAKPDETAWFQQADIADDDRALLVPGGVFYWSIGYSVVGGTKRRTSEVRFRRLPAWSRTDLAAAGALAASWEHLLGTDGVR